MRKIAVKLAIFFIVLMCVASFLSFLVSTFFTGNIKGEIKTHQQAIALSLMELDRKTDLSIDEIIGFVSSSMYRVYLIEETELEKLPREALIKVQNNEMVFLPDCDIKNYTTILVLRENYIGIGLHAHNTIFKIVASRLWISTLSYLLIGAALIAAFVKKAVKPVLRLNYATQEVAKGNFDIQINNTTNDEIGQLTKNFNRMTRELRNIEYLRKDFISNVSHEFKTPIASIQGFAKLLQKDNLSDDEKKEYVSIIVEETARLSKLSSNILKLSKLENQEIVGKKSSFYLDEQLRRSILLLEHQWSKKNIDFDIELDKVLYRGDEDLLQQVWINILDNAIKFSQKDGSIGIRLIQTSSEAVVKISDCGIGMDEETLGRIFEKFYQGDKAHSSEGSGLGLSLVKRILDLLGASITVESEVNKGSTFTIRLPKDL